MSKIKFGVVGLGHIGKRHAEMILNHSEAELIAVADVLSKEETHFQHSDIPYYFSLEEMLVAHPEMEVCHVCTPNGFHAQQSIKALQAKKNVVVEKPMALKKADCETIIHTALMNNKQVFVVMQNRYSPPSEWLKNIVENNILGDIYQVQINCYWNRDDRYYKKEGWKGTQDIDGGTLFTQFSHFIDIMYWVFGDIKNIQAKFHDFNHAHSTDFEDSGNVIFDFVKGGAGCINYSTSVWDKNMESSLTVIGSKGSIKIGGQYMDKIEYCHIENYEMPTLKPTNPANNYGPYQGSANNHMYVVENVIDSLKERNTVTTTALEGMKVVEIIERIYALK